jgi:hypothetical protein
MSKKNVMEKIREEIIASKMEVLDKSIMRIVQGVAQLLELDVDRLLREVLLVESGCLAIRCYYKQDEVIGTEDAIERVAKILSDHEAWDAYSSSKAPSAYKYAATVVVWMLLAERRVGNLIRVDCPLFSDSVTATIMWYLITRVAKPISDAINDVLRKIRLQDLASLCMSR